MSTDIIRNRILVGDVRTRLADIPDSSVHCIITSPPYYSLRDYGHVKQIGAEPTVQAWATAIAGVCNDLARVLRPDGVLWLNLGDGYARHLREGATRKCLLLGPERVALQMTRSGWLLRNKVVWAKRNPMPANVRDRLSTTHEYVYCFTREARYFFDLDAVREQPRTSRVTPRSSSTSYPPRGAVPNVPGGTSARVDLNEGLRRLRETGRDSHPLGKNPGDVWHLTTANYRGAHFATFPLSLVRTPLLATCPERACSACGAPWHREPYASDGQQAVLGSLHPSCDCHAPWEPGLILDPFIGAGTVAVAAERWKRDWLGIELNPVYAKLAEERIRNERPV